MSAVPSGLVGLCLAKPNVETLGYYHASLRDEHKILALNPVTTPHAVEPIFDGCAFFSGEYNRLGCYCQVCSRHGPAAKPDSISDFH